MTPLSQLLTEMRKAAEASPEVAFPGHSESDEHYELCSPANIIRLLDALEMSVETLKALQKIRGLG